MIMTLNEWMISNCVNAEVFGKKLGCAGQTVRRYCSGERFPDARVSEQIVTATGGSVSLQDLHETRLAFLRSISPQPEAEVA